MTLFRQQLAPQRQKQCVNSCPCPKISIAEVSSNILNLRVYHSLSSFVSMTCPFLAGENAYVFRHSDIGLQAQGWQLQQEVDGTLPLGGILVGADQCTSADSGDGPDGGSEKVIRIHES